MLAFPQLSSGAVGQFPLRRVTGYRTLVNRMGDASEVRLTDLDYFERRWELPVEGLTDAEWQAIQDLFTATEGRYRSFLFLEPGENLLEWSEKFSETAWVKSGVSVVEGIGDPFGGTSASQLTGAGTLSQSLSIPAWFRYAASVWARTTQAGASLEVSDGAALQQSVAFDSSGQWRRYRLATAWATTSETVVFRVAAPGGGAVDIYGAQLDPQPMASDYKKTLDQSGVHPGARFSSDTLGDRFTGPGQHSGVIQVTWTPSQT